MHPSSTRRCITPTNAILEDSEANEIRNRLSDAEVDLTNLNQQVSTTYLVHNELLHQLTEIIAEISACRICLAPHKKLPPELLSKIFHFCVTDTVCLPPKLYEGPLLLCQVSSYWRSVALGTPTLWNDIAVNFDSEYRTPDPNIVRTWLARSGVFISLSMTVSVADRYHLEPFTFEGLEIISYISRCRKLVLTVPFASLGDVLQLPGSHSEILEVLDLELFDIGDIIAASCWSRILAFLHSAHRLRSVTFRCAWNMLKCPQLLQLPFTQLADLHLIQTWLNLDTCQAILRQSINLVNCTMRVVSQDSEDFEPSLGDLDPIVVPKLRKFHLSTNHLPFLQPLVLPALKDFRFTYIDCSGRSCSAFLSLCSRSSFDLERFAIAGKRVNAHELELLLQQMPSLVELDISCQKKFKMSTLDMVSTGDLLPKLEVINVGSISSGAAPGVSKLRWRLDSDLSEARNCRGEPVSRLRKVVVNGSSLDCGHRLLGLFEEQGLVIS